MKLKNILTIIAMVLIVLAFTGLTKSEDYVKCDPLKPKQICNQNYTAVQAGSYLKTKCLTVKSKCNQNYTAVQADNYLKTKCTAIKSKDINVCKDKIWQVNSDITEQVINTSTDTTHYAFNITDLNSGKSYILFTNKNNIDNMII